MTVAETIVVGRTATLGGGEGFGWVEALAIADGRVVAAGSRAEVEQLAGPGTRRIALGPDEIGLPGLTDAHVHLADAALAADRVELAGAASLDEALDLVAAAAARRPGRDVWLEGGGWDPNRWGRWPTSDDLEAAARGRRIALWAHDHHALLVSRRALAEAGIDATTPDPPGGTIRRGKGADARRGAPSGVLHEHASRLVTARIPPPDDASLDAAIERWCAELLPLGLVAIHDMGALAPDRALRGGFAAAARLDAAGRLPVRVHAGIREESLDSAIERGHRTGEPIGPGQGRARVGWWKRFADGSLGSRTAFLREAYEDAATGATDRRGVALIAPVGLRPEIVRAAEAGIATAVHAIGDAAVDLAIASLEGGAGAAMGAQPRIEHAQLVADDQLPRLRQAGIALSMQPVHARTDGASLGPAWGERARRGYRWRSIVAAGLRLAFGSDAPVETADPWPGLAVAIDRSAATLGASAAWLDPAEALALPSALRGACVAPALIAGERDRGRLVVGQRADLVVVRLPPEGRLDDPAVLATLRPRLVLVDGAIAWEA